MFRYIGGDAAGPTPAGHGIPQTATTLYYRHRDRRDAAGTGLTAAAAVGHTPDMRVRHCTAASAGHAHSLSRL